MILIRQGYSNNIVMTLNELASISPFDILIEFTNDTTGEVKYFTAIDVSPATERYNQYTITENTIEDLYNGTVSLNPVGYWSYVIYEMPISSPPSLNVANATKELENGKVLVIANSETVTPSFDEDDKINNIVFE